jgi:hypothetical protein
MGNASVLTLGQRGPDARQEVPMSTPKPLYAHERVTRPMLGFKSFDAVQGTRAGVEHSCT